MSTKELVGIPAKKNQDGSFSASIAAGHLTNLAFVDFYDDQTSEGYQRFDSTRASRGKQIAEYVNRCNQNDSEPKLFELTCNLRIGDHYGEEEWVFDSVNGCGDRVGQLMIDIAPDVKVLSVIDGGTRLLGIENAIALGYLTANHNIDVRVFMGLSVPEEIAQFLLINERQKRVRTDLSIRVLQQKLDSGDLTNEEIALLETVMDEKNQWRYTASTMIGALNEDEDSPWQGLIQMPNDRFTKPVKLQSFISSLNPLLTNPNLTSKLEAFESSGFLKIDGQKASRQDFLVKILKNFWDAVAETNPRAREEPRTTVLWGAIGAAAMNIALAEIMASILESSTPNLDKDRFKGIIKASDVSEYAFWFSRKGSGHAGVDYPGEKGQAAGMVGAANHRKLAASLLVDWRRELNAVNSTVVISV